MPRAKISMRLLKAQYLKIRKYVSLEFTLNFSCQIPRKSCQKIKLEKHQKIKLPRNKSFHLKLVGGTSSIYFGYFNLACNIWKWDILSGFQRQCSLMRYEQWKNSEPKLPENYNFNHHQSFQMSSKSANQRFTTM